jgi:hypothetical protein
VNLRHLGYLVAIAQERTHICDVEVDPETGKVQVLRYTAVQDVGRAIQPSYAEGQIRGRAVQGIGWALHEEFIYNSNGRLDNQTFLDYRMPLASDVPMIEARHHRGGQRETPTRHSRRRRSADRATAGGGCECHSQRTGLRPTELPVSPPKVLAAMTATS